MTLLLYIGSLAAYGAILVLLTSYTGYRPYTTYLLWLGLIAGSPLFIPGSLVYCVCDLVYKKMRG